MLNFLEKVTADLETTKASIVKNEEEESIISSQVPFPKELQVIQESIK